MTDTLHLQIDQGATFDKSFRYRDANGDPLDLSGYSLRAQLRQNYTSSVAANFGTEISDPTGGEFRLVLSASGSMNLTPGNFVWDVEASINATVIRLVGGTAEITPEVTK